MIESDSITHETFYSYEFKFGEKKFKDENEGLSFLRIAVLRCAPDKGSVARYYDVISKVPLSSELRPVLNGIEVDNPKMASDNYVQMVANILGSLSDEKVDEYIKMMCDRQEREYEEKNRELEEKQNNQNNMRRLVSLASSIKYQD